MGEDQALARLAEVLARPTYQASSNVNKPWWEQLWQPLGDMLNYVLVRFAQSVLDAVTGREGAYGLGVAVVCVVLIGLAGLYLARAIRLSLTSDRAVGDAHLAARRERSERLWQSAQDLATAGHLTEATRRLYLSALYALDERALVHIDTSLTNREHARAVDGRHPRVADAFSQVVERYDRLRYGGEVISSGTFGDLSRLVQHSRTLALERQAP